MAGRSLEVDEDLRHQRRYWRLRRVAYVVVAAIIVAAVLGLLGTDGPLSDATAGGGETEVRIDYERTTRYLVPHTLTVDIPAAMGGENVRLWIDRDYIDGFETQGVYPEPEAVEAGRDRLVYVFAREDRATPLRVTFHLRALRRGIREARLGVPDTNPVRFRQVVFP